MYDQMVHIQNYSVFRLNTEIRGINVDVESSSKVFNIKHPFHESEAELHQFCIKKNRTIV
jgi:hypothetical protein